MKYHHFDLNIETLTPLHIGNGETLTSTGEYVVIGNQLKIIDQESLIDLLQERGLFEDYIKEISNYGSNTDIWSFFSKNNIEKEVTYTREIKINIPDLKVGNNRLLDIAAKVNEDLYLAGSSIKGALRAILFFYYLKKDSATYHKVEKILSENNSIKKIKKQVAYLEEKLFTKDFHFVRIEDSKPIEKSQASIELSKRQHLYGLESEGLGSLRECISEGSMIKSRLSIIPQINDKLIKFLNKEDFKSLFAAINEVTKQNIEFEIKLLSKSTDAIAKELINFLKQQIEEINTSDNNYAIFRLGKGKTYFFQTLAAFVSNDANEKLLSLMLKEYDSSKIFPNTRVLNAKNKMFGFVKMTITNTEFYDSDTLSKLKLKDNKIDEIIQKKTPITAYNIDSKYAAFLINGVEHKAQLIKLHKKIVFKKNQVLKAVIWQMSKEGKITQIKTKEE